MANQYSDLALGWTILDYNPGGGKTSRPAVGPIHWVLRIFFLEVKQPWREADNSQSGSEV